MAIEGIRKFGMAIDYETSGYILPDYTSKHQGISFGAIIFDVSTFEPVEELYREIKFNPKYEWNNGAEKVHSLSREYLEEHGVSQEEAACDLANLVVKYMGTDEIILLGHRVNFDKAFTIQLMDTVDIKFNYHPTIFDTCAFASAFMELAYSDSLFKVLGLPDRKAHNAMEDIRMTLLSMKKMKEFFINGIASSL